MNESNDMLEEIASLDSPFCSLAQKFQNDIKLKQDNLSINIADQFWDKLSDSNGIKNSQEQNNSNSQGIMMLNSLMLNSIKIIKKNQQKNNDQDFFKRIPNKQLNLFLKQLNIEVKWISKSSSLTKASLHYLFSGVVQQKCFRYTFELSSDIIKKIIKNYKQQPTNISKIYIKKMTQLLQQKMNIKTNDENFFVLSISSNQSKLYIDFFFSDPNIIQKNINDLSKYCGAKFQIISAIKYLTFSNEDFEPKFNINNWIGGIYLRGPFEQIPKGLYTQLLNYQCPNQQYLGFGIKVQNYYKLNGQINNQWMGQDGSSQNWCVAFSVGVQNEKIRKLLKKANIKLDTQINLNLINKRKIVGNGLICTPKIDLAYNLCQDNCKIIFHCRINPYKVNVCKSFPNIWVINEIQDIRPYRIIIKKN